jgi:putative peptidoglycan lipid II flippase
MSQILKSSGAMAGATLMSRLLGLVREQAYAWFMGDGAAASAFKLAFQIPNLFRRLLGEGALTAAFVPIFKARERTEGEQSMWEAANATMSALIVATTAIAGVVMIGVSVVLALSRVTYTVGGEPVFPPWPIPILTDDTRLMLQLLRLMFPYLILVCLAALCMGMLNARGYFFLPALGATLLNVVMISTVFLVAPHWGKTLDQQVFALGVAVLVAGVAQFTFQLPVLRKQGWRFRWINPRGHPVVREVIVKMIPGTIGVAAFQINVLLIQLVAFSVDRNLVASFDYAVRLMEFPQGVVGISLATYLLPTLAGIAAEKKYDDFRGTLRGGLGLLFFLNLPAAVLLLTLAEPIVRLLFERGAFTPAATHRAALALACLAPGLVAFSGVNVVARAFFALGDTRTPMRVSVFCLALNLIISLLLIGPFRQVGLGIANSLTSFVNLWLLLRALRKKLKRLDLAPLRPSLLALAGATVVAGLVAWLSAGWWSAHWGHANLLLKLGEVFVPAGVAVAVYGLLALWQRVPEAREVARFFRELSGRGT